jgi:hypothetical protein
MPQATANAAIQCRQCLSDSIPESESVIHVSNEVAHHDVRYRLIDGCAVAGGGRPVSGGGIYHIVRCHVDRPCRLYVVH